METRVTKYSEVSATLTFKTEASFFTAFKVLKKRYRSLIQINPYANEIHLNLITQGNRTEELKNIVRGLKRKPKYFVIKLKHIEAITEKVIY